jgi:exodeoxyribonuclease V alpha subunit
MNAPAFYKQAKPLEAMPHTASALAAYISAERSFVGIGPARAAALYKEYGDGLYTALLECSYQVVRMIGEDNAITASAVIRERGDEIGVIDTLDQLGLYQILGAHKAIRIARAWGKIGAQAITDNPYCLLSLLGWKSVDKAARHLGINERDPRRITGAVEHVLGKVLAGNNTLEDEHVILKGAQELLGYEITDAIIEATVKTGGALRLGDKLQPVGAGRMEVECAVLLKKLSKQRPSTDLALGKITDAEIEAEIDSYEGDRPFRLTQAQRSAVKAAHQHRFFCLAGYAGSGKTTVLRAICDTLEGFGRQPIIMTLSGRAAQRASESTGRETMTIAAFMAKNDKDNVEPLSANKIVIVDEASMCALPDIWRILKRLGDAQLILCGDPAQLPPISFGLVFHVLTGASEVPCITLDRVMRQRADSGIPAIAEAIRSGQSPVLEQYDGMQPGVTFNECSDEDTISMITRIGIDLKKNGIASDDVQIIGSIKAGKAGVSAINEYYHSKVIERGAEVWPNTGHIAAGEPLIWTKNDKKIGLTNGSMGRVIGFEDDMVQAFIDGKDFELDPITAGMMTELAYAITVHKGQGSQWPVVIIPCFKNRLMDRSMIYTAITRAETQVILIGDREALDTAIETPPVALRRKVGFPTWLDLAGKKR